MQIRRQLTRVIGCTVLIATCVTAVFAHPGSAIAVDRQGQVYFVDTGSGVWKIDRSGRLVRHDGPAFHWMAIDMDGSFRTTPMPSGSSYEIRQAGANPTLILSSDFPAVIGPDLAFYYPEAGRDGRVRVVRLTGSGSRSVRATLPASTESGPLRWLNGLAAGRDGSIYYAEDRAVRRIDPRGRISTVAGNIAVTGCAAIPGIEAPDGPYLRGLDVAADGTVYVAASGCGALLKITPQGRVSPILRSTSPWSPTAVAVAGSDLYVLEYLHTASDNRREWVPRVRKVQSNGTVSVVAAVERR